MNWVRNNRFLAALLAVLIVVGGALIFLLITAQSRYADVAAQYESQVTELQRLQKLPMFPDDDNLKKYETIRQDYQKEVINLQTSLAALDPAPANPPLTPLQFQDKLRQVVEETVQKAQTAGVGLPEGFYLGFEQYRGAPPENAATALLTTQLGEIQNLMDLLINQHIDKLTSIKRGLLPQEGAPATAAAAAPAPGRPGAPGAPVTAPLVSKYPLEIAFTALPSAFREALNKITSDKELYIIRALQVKNQVDKGPPRLEGGAPGGPAPTPAAPAPGGTDANGVPVPPLPDKGPAPLRYVVGQERLDVIARIDLVSVKPPATVAAR